jgi:hypothetical protein
MLGNRTVVAQILSEKELIFVAQFSDHKKDEDQQRFIAFLHKS